ncbi:Transcription-coupled repair protein CSB/RAD26 (contains SNF2 family DNA-dependent ATPase domain) [Handroanthus impetiginosus]|uniref:Transcription-coupled repair protein CSB/RAD26 (Contains SNF2 family DNA-dependent ATPase domain) n=1 Tax=Handroanthus impetiginosus TaxID=429701 RepID=A0A2G9I7V8_9LAMI|nr:Transcription-coupled repair protein CSB/RAD26 (contains SNF2 family DNA-dependent ATPase domain) [Handroanthus impetiginosus]
MSFNAFKEALKPCKTNLSSSSSSSFSSSQISQEFDSTLSRKPPKTSLSRQLLRLQDDNTFCSEIQQKSCKGGSNLIPGSEKDGDNIGNEEIKEENGLKGPKMEFFRHFDHSGPYEPLALSPPGEIPVVQVPASINSRLLKHQKEGVKFLYNLYRNTHGGVLGDDMGLGKTIQTIAFLAAVFGKDSEPDLTYHKEEGEKKGPVLIVCPSSVILNWESEFSKWSTFSVSVYHGANRDLIIDKLEAHGVEILITSFDTYRIQGSILSDIPWEIVVVDEAHRLKNEKSKLYTACLQIRTLKRYGLTGTIMQNKIMDLFNLFDWVAPGCLGTREHFREFYDEPLKHGQRSSAPQRFVQIADERKQHLVSVLRKYMLRRTKEETIGHLMLGKEDNVVFCAMTELQKRVYQRALQLPDIQCLVNKDLPCSCGSPLKQFECCKRTVPDGVIWPYLHRNNPEGCDSCPFCLVLPCLVKLQQLSNHLELIKPNPKDDQDKQRKDAEFASAVFGTDINLVGGSGQIDSFMGLSDVRHCGKMRTLERLLHSWISAGDKILLFSYSVRMLDILEKFIIRKGYSFSRLDGSTPTSLRQSLVDDFNSSPSKQVFLISTRAGGLGLNLVSANRVVIFDPNWNPAQDLQAQDRSFRFGQKRHVIVFRLLAAGTLEELVYTRQVYKQQLSNIAVAGKMEKRYFEGVQDCKEFQGELFGICNLFRDLSDKLFTSEIVELHGKQEKENDHNRNATLDSTGHGDSPQKEIESRDSAECEGDELKDRRKKRGDPMLKDLGVVYAHRNEDIVNLRSMSHVDGKPSIRLKEDSKQPCQSPPAEGSNKEPDTADVVELKEDSPHVSDSSKRRKSEPCSLLALYMGIDEVELNKLLLSELPAQRQ